MKALIFSLSLIILTACGSSNGGSTEQRSFNPNLVGGGGSPVNPGGGASCTIPAVGQYQNNSDGIIATVGERNGECGIQLSCGLIGYIYDLGGNQYFVIVDTPSGDTVGGCAFPANSTSYQGKHGPYNSGVTFGNYAGIGWQGGFLPSEANNPWTKLL